MVKLEIKKRHLSIFVIVILVLGIGFVFAQVGNAPDPGHEIAELQLCENNQILKVINEEWTCETGGGGLTCQDIFSPNPGCGVPSLNVPNGVTNALCFGSNPANDAGTISCLSSNKVKFADLNFDGTTGFSDLLDDTGGTGGGSGTVTSVGSGNGLTGGPITTSGTLSVNAPTCSGTDKLTWTGSAFSCATDQTGGGGGGGWTDTGTRINLVNTGDQVVIGALGGSTAAKLGIFGGDLRVGTGTAPALLVDESAKRVGIGDSTPDEALDVVGNIITTGYIKTGTGTCANGNICSKEDLRSGDELYINRVSFGGTGNSNLVWDQTTKLVSYGSSSERYKEDIKDLEEDFYKILSVEPRSFKYKSNGVEDIGYIAEEFDKLGLNKLVVYFEGRPESLSYEKVSLYLVEVVKDQQQTIESQQEQIDELTKVICRWAPYEDFCN